MSRQAQRNRDYEAAEAAEKKRRAAAMSINDLIDLACEVIRKGGE
jgi:hypothetical protein